MFPSYMSSYNNVICDSDNFVVCVRIPLVADLLGVDITFAVIL